MATCLQKERTIRILAPPGPPEIHKTGSTCGALIDILFIVLQTGCSCRSKLNLKRWVHPVVHVLHNALQQVYRNCLIVLLPLKCATQRKLNSIT